MMITHREFSSYWVVIARLILKYPCSEARLASDHRIHIRHEKRKVILQFVENSLVIGKGRQSGVIFTDENFPEWCWYVFFTAGGHLLDKQTVLRAVTHALNEWEALGEC